MEQSLTPARLIRRREVLARTGLSQSTLYDLIKQGEFPAPVKISAQAVAWHAQAIEAWITSRPKSAIAPSKAA